MRLIIVGGGTGGHITPGITIARSLLEKVEDAQVLFVGTQKGLEMDLVPKAGLPITTIPAAPFNRKISLQLFLTGFISLQGVLASITLLRRFRPDLIMGTGGFVCAPFLLAAVLLKVPFILQEQNVMPGLTNRLFSSFARRIALGFKEAEAHFSCSRERLIYTGNPINQELMALNRLAGAKRLGIDANKKVLLIYGGSRGAKSINQAALKAYPHLVSLPDLTILHICGQGNREEIWGALEEMGLAEHRDIHLYEYVYDISACLVVADLVLARAGAVGLSEILALGIPSLLVPYPYAADNHQYENARVVEEAQAGMLIPDHKLASCNLAECIRGLLADPVRLKEYSFRAKELAVLNSAEKILDILLNEMEEKGIP